MCAIFGISFLKGGTNINPEDISRYLFVLMNRSQARGTHATGLAFVTDKKITVLKLNLQATDFVCLAKVKDTVYKFLKGDLGKPYSIVGHCRYETKGSYTNNFNNHPIIANNFVGVHNGVIRNDDELFAKYKTLSRNFVRSGEVDSEIIFRLIDYNYNERKLLTYQAISRTTSELAGSYACAVVNSELPSWLWLFRAHGPTAVRYNTTRGIIVYASLPVYIDGADNVINLGEFIEVNYEEDSGISFDLEEGAVVKFETKINTEYKLAPGI